jgi:hypothetical protein
MENMDGFQTTAIGLADRLEIEKVMHEGPERLMNSLTNCWQRWNE